MKLLNIEWKQDGNKVYFDYMGKEIFFKMPSNYEISKTHPDLFKLAEWLMFSPWHNVLNDHNFTRQKGKNNGLCFSAGVDSTALHLLYPKSKMVYAERNGLEETMLIQDNALRMIGKMEEEVIIVKTNFEIIRTFHGLGIGYSTAIGMGVPLVLLSDYLDLGSISYGKVMDDQFFPKGIFRNYTKEFMERQKLLIYAGLEGIYPMVGCSEVISTEIVNNSKYANFAFSCLRGKMGIQCNNCFKCFRKNILKGKEAKLDRETVYCINKNPPKMIPCLLYGLNKEKYDLKQLNLDYLKEHDVSMLNKVYSPAYNIYSEEVKKEILYRLNKFGYETMNKKEEEKLKKLDFRRKR